MKAAIITSLITLSSLSVAHPGPKTSRNDAHRIVDRSVQHCYNEFPQLCNYQDAINCANYLIGLGTQTCAAGTGAVKMCHMGDCYVYGQAAGGASSASSYCKDVGYDVQNIANTCLSAGLTGGYNPAGGNGNLQIYVKT